MDPVPSPRRPLAPLAPFRKTRRRRQSRAVTGRQPNASPKASLLVKSGQRPGQALCPRGPSSAQRGVRTRQDTNTRSDQSLRPKLFPARRAPDLSDCAHASEGACVRACVRAARLRARPDDSVSSPALSSNLRPGTEQLCACGPAPNTAQDSVCAVSDPAMNTAHTRQRARQENVWRTRACAHCS